MVAFTSGQKRQFGINHPNPSIFKPLSAALSGGEAECTTTRPKGIVSIQAALLGKLDIKVTDNGRPERFQGARICSTVGGRTSSGEETPSLIFKNSFVQVE